VFKEVAAAGFKLLNADAADGKLKENWIAIWGKA
jgi:hypothetical protein